MALLDTLGKRLKALRADLGMSQKELAHLADTSQAYLSRIENDGVPGVRGQILARIADALGTTTDYVLGLSDDPLPPADFPVDDLPADLRLLHKRIESLPLALRGQVIEYLVQEVEKAERTYEQGQRAREAARASAQA